MAMQEYAWVIGGVIQRYQHFEEGEQPTYEVASKGGWLPVIREQSPSFNPLTETLSTEVVVSETSVTITQTVEPLPLEIVRENLHNKRRQIFTQKIHTGYPAGNGKYIQINDGSRANLSGMALTAVMVQMNLTTWPEGYSRGWVTEDGSRIPLPTPEDGLALATAAGAYYADAVQADQDLENAIKNSDGNPWPTIEE